MEFYVENYQTGRSSEVTAKTISEAVDVHRQEVGETGDHTYHVTDEQNNETVVEAVVATNYTIV